MLVSCLRRCTQGLKSLPTMVKPSFSATAVNVHQFHSSRPALGFEEFADVKKPNEVLVTGRSWTAAELRRKVLLPFIFLTYSLFKSILVLLKLMIP